MTIKRHTGIRTLRLRGLSGAGTLLTAFLLSACGSVSYRAGSAFDPGLLETELMPEKSTSIEVRRVLGAPSGQGRAMMPFHESPRTVWTYYSEQGRIDMSGGSSSATGAYLFVFLKDGIYDGYLWYRSRFE